MPRNDLLRHSPKYTAPRRIITYVPHQASARIVLANLVRSLSWPALPSHVGLLGNNFRNFEKRFDRGSSLGIIIYARQIRILGVLHHSRCSEAAFCLRSSQFVHGSGRWRVQQSDALPAGPLLSDRQRSHAASA